MSDCDGVLNNRGIGSSFLFGFTQWQQTVGSDSLMPHNLAINLATQLQALCINEMLLALVPHGNVIPMYIEHPDIFMHNSFVFLFRLDETPKRKFSILSPTPLKPVLQKQLSFDSGKFCLLLLNFSHSLYFACFVWYIQ